ncbi:MAG: hypothetical protein IPO02_05915 [Bacteroidetes bacterium]|nr:hypothetical protein [Bacteroidota bacterium]
MNYHLPEREDVNYNDYDTANFIDGDKVFLTKYDDSTSDIVLIGKSIPNDIIKLFGKGEIDTSFDRNLTTSNNPNDHYVTGKWIHLFYKEKGLSFSFQKPYKKGESPEEILTSKDHCLLHTIKLVSPSDYYLDNVFAGMTYGAVIRKFKEASWNIHNGIVYDSYGLHLTFDKKVYNHDTTARLNKIERTKRFFYLK